MKMYTHYYATCTETGVRKRRKFHDIAILVIEFPNGVPENNARDFIQHWNASLYGLEYVLEDPNPGLVIRPKLFADEI